MPDSLFFSNLNAVSSGIFEREIVEPVLNTQGFRSMAISSDGRYLAAGDTIGNLHIYDLQTSDYACLQVKPSQCINIDLFWSKKKEHLDLVTLFLFYFGL